jgi:multidrug efflux pump
VLVTQFNSFYQTGLTLFTIVLSVFGVLLGMAVTGQKFSVIMTGTGVIALAGIVVNNAIILIDTFNREQTIQPDLLTATLATAAQRIRPILLTTITTIAGLIPMATQVNLDLINQTTAVGGITAIWWVQLSTAIISGLAFSTLLTLVVVPVMLAAPETVSRTWARLRGRAPAIAAPAAPAPALALAGGAPQRPLEVWEPVRPMVPPAAVPVPLRAAGEVAASGRAPARRDRPAEELDVYAAVLAPAPRRRDEEAGPPAPGFAQHPEAAE